uniref:Serpentine receptor class gamma n=1 Tax=Meloidogyne floridensis TaxID=298350 RepID=A0A915NI17_9BILA
MNTSTPTSQTNQTELIIISPFIYSLLNILSTNVAIPHIVAGIIGIPSALLYIFELIILYKKWKEFKSSFFVLFSLRAIIIWKKPRMIAAILFSCVAPLIVTIHIFQYKVYLKEVKSNGFILSYAALTGTNLIGFIKGQQLFGPFYSSNNGVATLASFFFMGISIILNIYTLICYKRKHYIPQNSPQLSANKLLVERRITVFVLVTFIGQLIVSIFMISWYIVSSPLKPYMDTDTYNITNYAVLNQSPWVNDISTIALPAWLMLWANERLKCELSKLVYKTKNNFLQMIGVKQHSMVTIFDSSQIQNVNQRISIQKSMASDVRRNLTNTLRENEDRKRVSIQP